jgi:hypothetical protein
MKYFLENLDEDVVLHAMARAAAENIVTWQYIKGILKDYISKGIKDMSGVIKDDEAYNANKAALQSNRKGNGSASVQQPVPGASNKYGEPSAEDHLRIKGLLEAVKGKTTDKTAKAAPSITDTQIPVPKQKSGNKILSRLKEACNNEFAPGFILDIWTSIQDLNDESLLSDENYLYEWVKKKYLSLQDGFAGADVLTRYERLMVLVNEG